MDALEYLTGKRVKLHEVYASETSLSFCTISQSSQEGLRESLDSIASIAEELGFPYEIIVVVPKSSPHSGEYGRGRHNSGKLYLVRENTRSHGEALRIAFESSSCKYFIPFNSSISYDIRYADLMHSFLMKKEKKLFLSELPVIHRDLVKDAGGYRDLNYGYDIDLYSRIAMLYGIVAYPALFNTIPIVSPPPSRRDSASSEGKEARNITDHIIACNYDLGDTLALYCGESGSRKPGKTIFYSLLYAFSRLSKVKPYRFDRNNYLVLMENVFESLILRDYARYGMEDIKANMMLTSGEVKYLKNRSKLYRDVLFSMSQYVVEN